jgi:hypothetical protein
VAKGVVKDKATGEKLPFVIINVMYNDSIIAKSVTDIDGKYEVKIPKEYSKIDIKAIYIGYMAKIVKGIPIAAPYQPIVLDFELQLSEEIMLDGVMIMEKPLPNDKVRKKKSK